MEKENKELTIHLNCDENDIKKIMDVARAIDEKAKYSSCDLDTLGVFEITDFIYNKYDLQYMLKKSVGRLAGKKLSNLGLDVTKDETALQKVRSYMYKLYYDEAIDGLEESFNWFDLVLGGIIRLAFAIYILKYKPELKAIFELLPYEEAEKFVEREDYR